MNFNKTTEYALRIFSLMAHDDTRSYTTNDIYEALHIPFRYLRKLMTVFTKYGLMESIQGKFGGYRLAKKSDAIFLYDIVMATESTFLGEMCFFGFTSCALSNECVMHQKWAKVRKDVTDVLKSTSLKEIETIHLNSK